MMRTRYLTPSVQKTRERRTHLKQRHHNQNTTNRKPKGVSFPKNGKTAIQNKTFTKT